MASPGSQSADGGEQGVTIRVTNAIQAPHFDFQITLPYVLGSSLHSYMERAVERDPQFKISASYFGKTLGYTVHVATELDKDPSAEDTWWTIRNAEGDLQLGPSNYKPKVGETITFALTDGSDCTSTNRPQKRYGVTLCLINSIQDPMFDIKITLPYVPQSPLLSYLERAQEEDEQFRFKASYHGESLGYYVDVLNELKANYENEGTWWRLGYSETPGPTVGPSFYVPVDGEEIQFTFTKDPKSADNFRPRPGVTLHVLNSVKEPHFDFLTIQPYVPGSTLRSYLERAAENNRKFRFTATYNGQTEQYSLVGINKLNADTNTSWRLADAEGRPLKEGMSKHLPKDGETVQLIFTEG